MAVNKQHITIFKEVYGREPDESELLEFKKARVKFFRALKNLKGKTIIDDNQYNILADEANKAKTEMLESINLKLFISGKLNEASVIHRLKNPPVVLENIKENKENQDNNNEMDETIEENDDEQLKKLLIKLKNHYNYKYRKEQITKEEKDKLISELRGKTLEEILLIYKGVYDKKCPHCKGVL